MLIPVQLDSTVEPVEKKGNGQAEREMLKNFIPSQRAGETHYLCCETITYIGSGKEIKGNNMEDKRRQTRAEMHIWSIDGAMT